MSTGSKLPRSSFFLTLAAFLAAPSTAAYAQDDTGVVVEGADEVVEDDGTTEQDGEVIVVTGSAIERRDLTTSAPLAIVDKTELEASGMASVGEILQNLPSQSNAINVQFNNGGDGSTRINLRGLGTGRTLVLVNGRRHVAGGSGADSSVDLNAIPLAAIERVEVLKDGASAVYGSDAIGGVVNIITRNDFEGAEATAYYGSTADGLATVYDVSMTAGISGKKGNAVFSAGYYQQNPMYAGSREFSKTDKFYDWQESCTELINEETGERRVLDACVDTWDAGGSSSTPNGYIRDLTGEAGNEAWQDVINSTCPEPGGGCEIGSYIPFGTPQTYNYQPENYLVTPQRRYNLFSTGRYKLTDNTNAFFEASYLNRTSDQQLAAEPLFTRTEGIVVAADNYYNPFGRSFGDVRRRFIEAGNRRRLQNIDTTRLVLGVEGRLDKDLEFFKGWRWNAAFNYGRNAATELKEGNFILSNLEEALGSSFVDPESGAIRCGTLDNPGSEGCVPLNLFGGPGTITQDMLDYITYTGVADGFNEMRSWTFNTSGRLAETPWGGDVALATGFEYRSEAGGVTPDPLTASGNTTGNKSDPTGGSFDVYEAYGELSVVPVVGKPMAEWLEITAAARTSRYNTFGQATSGKLGGLWRIQSGVSLRGTYSSAFRAPGIPPLYAGAEDSFPGATDPCDNSQGPRSDIVDANCRADGVADDYEDNRTQMPAVIGGNPDLEPETAKILTAGVVYEPHFVDNLAFTLDYFSVDVDNAIGTKGVSVILANCYAQEVREDCDKITRDPTGYITRIDNRFTNTGGDETAGLDFSARYDHMTTIGRFRYNLEGTWLQKYNEIQETRTVVGKGVYDLGVFPAWKWNVGALWGKGAWGAGLNARFIGSIDECEDDDCRQDEDLAEEELPLRRTVGTNVTGDLFLNWAHRSPMGMTRLTIGMNNVLDQAPAVIYNGFLATSDASTYDFLGRYTYVRLVQQF